MPRGSGRRPKPTKLRKLGGKAGHRALNEKEPTPPAIAPEMPPGLSKLAAKEWKSIVPQLEQLGMISRIDGKALAGYCHAYARWAQAEKRIEEFGIVMEEPVFWREGASLKPRIIAYRHKKNPACNISEAALKTMKSFLIEFGMTPAARSRLHVEKPPSEEKDPFESFLSRGGKSSDTKHVN